jgi:hypothetical protein
VNLVHRFGLARASCALAPLFLFAACASKQAPTTAEMADAKTPVCVREYRVGSNIPTTNCAVPQTEAERQRTVDDFKAQMHQIPSNAKGSGG